MKINENEFAPATIAVPLKKTDKDFIFLPKAKEDEVKIFVFTDHNKFMKYVSSDFIFEIAEKCNADFLGYCEQEVLFPDTLPTAVEIVSRAIDSKKNSDIKDYLEKTKEFMELAMSLDTFIQFNF